MQQIQAFSYIAWRIQTIQCNDKARDIMVGRTRHRGPREKNGRKQRTYVCPTTQVMAQPHRQGVAEEYRGFPEAESRFGRLMLKGKITPAQHEAGRTYALLCNDFRMTYGLPSINPRAIDLSSGRGISTAVTPPHILQAIQKRYDEAFIACGTAGRKASMAVKSHAVFDERVPNELALGLLKAGLDALIGHFGVNPNLQMVRRKAQPTERRAG